MKRDFLTETLGLEKDVVNAIMAEYGKSIQSEKDKQNELQKQLDEAQEAIKQASESNEDIEKIKKDLDEYKTKFEETSQTLANERKELKIKEALTVAGGEDVEYLKFKLGEVEDLDKLDELVESLKKELPAHFGEVEVKAETEPEGYKVVSNAIDSGDSNKTLSMDEIRNMSADEINEHWELVQTALEQSK